MAPPLSHRRTRVLLGAAVTALLCWKIIPGTALDRAAFSFVARGFVNPPYFIGGFGSRETPWNLRTFSSSVTPDPRHAPLVVSLGDDPQGIFQSSPPSPVDLAVVFTNFQRLGAKKAASSAVLAWDSPDVMGLAALDKAISRFDSMVMAAPLSRGTSPQPMPSAFRKTSVPLETLIGDASKLPIVNRIPLPDVILGGKNTSAGFQSIDSEPQTTRPHLLARWEDRVVFAFPLVVVLQRLDIPVDAVEIRPGKYLKLGRRGPVVPIDRFGRMSIPMKRVRPFAEIPAEVLIDGGAELFPRQAPDPAILRDDRSSAETGTRDFSARLAGVISVISSNSGMASALNYARPRATAECILLLAILLLVSAASCMPRFSRNLSFGIITAACIGLQFIAFASAELWLPGLAALAVVCVAAGICLLPVPEPEAESEKTLVADETATVEPETPPAFDPPPPAPEIFTHQEPEPLLEIHVSPEPAKKKARAPRKKPTPVSDTESITPKPRKSRAKKAVPPAEPEAPKPARKAAKKAPSRSRKKTDA